MTNGESEREVERCPACLAAAEPGQTYCLECGERLAQPGLQRTSPLREALRRRGAPALVIAGLVLVAAGAGLAWTFSRGDTSVAGTIASSGASTTGTSTVPATTPVTPVSTATASGVTTFSSTAPPGSTVPTPSTSSTPSTSTTPTTSTTPGTGSTAVDDDWPVGRTGYAVMLLSKEEARFDRSYMETQKAAAGSKSLESLGILNSDGYSSLNAGYWVLYQGPFATLDAARAAARVAKTKGFAFAYPRRVSA